MADLTGRMRAEHPSLRATKTGENRQEMTRMPGRKRLSLFTGNDALMEE
jgi:hypothetical protein